MTPPEVRQTIVGDHNIVTGTGDVNIVYTLSAADGDERRSLLVLLERVRRFWITGVLDSSVHGAALLELGAARMSDAVEHPWERVLELPGAAAQAVPAERGILELFDESGRALLVLGAEGSGKTTALLQLARALVDRAERDPAQAIPVVLSLGSWTGSRQALLPWIVAELQSRYYVPPRIGKAWLEKQRLALLLDGLDEVPEGDRTACVQAINRFLHDLSVPGVAVCCRVEDYLALPQRLSLGGAVRLEPLSAEQVERYLEAGGEGTAGLRDLLARDEAARDLARSPLLLSVMTLAFQGTAADTAFRMAATDAERRAQIFDAYVDRMFARRGRDAPPYTKAETLRWLGSIGHEMLRHGQRVLQVEGLQPSWLPSRPEVVVYALLSPVLGGLVLGAVEAMFYCIMVFGFNYRNYQTQVGVGALASAGLFVGLGFVLVVGVAGACRLLMRRDPAQAGRPEPAWVTGSIITLYWAAFAALVWATGIDLGRAPFGLVWAMLFALRGRCQSLPLDVQPIFGLAWSPRRALTGAFMGTLIGAGLTLMTLIVSRGSFSPWGLVFFTSIYTLIGASFGGVTRVLDAGASRLSGVRLTLRAARRGAWLTGVVAGGVFALLLIAFIAVTVLVDPAQWQTITRGLSQAGLRATAFFVLLWLVLAVLTLAVPVGLYFAVFGALWYGALDISQHAILRVMLAARRTIPLRLPRFLEYSTRLVFLQRVGGGYRFVHGALLEHLARPGSR